MSILAEELILKILLLLPVKSLIRFQSVSKSWRALIRDPYFIEMHLQHSIQSILLVRCYVDTYCSVNLNHKPMKVFQWSCVPKWDRLIGNSCNGLFCTRDLEDRFVIWNPSIRKHKMIPPMELGTSNFYEYELNVGFGYDQVNDDYKVMKIVQFSELEEPETFLSFDVLVYSLKENSWKRVGDELLPKVTLPFLDGTYLNGNIHWLVYNRAKETPYPRAILAFDFTIEKFQIHPFPMESLFVGGTLGVLGGKLCVFKHNSLWMMKEYGVVSSWSLLYTSPENKFSSCKPLVVSEDGQEFLIEKVTKYFWCNIEKESKRAIEILDIPNEHNGATLSQESLVLIDGDNDDDNIIQFNAPCFFI